MKMVRARRASRVTLRGRMRCGPQVRGRVGRAFCTSRPFGRRIAAGSPHR
jgi:hypothetical protein